VVRLPVELCCRSLAAKVSNEGDWFKYQLDFASIGSRIENNRKQDTDANNKKLDNDTNTNKQKVYCHINVL